MTKPLAAGGDRHLGLARNRLPERLPVHRHPCGIEHALDLRAIASALGRQAVVCDADNPKRATLVVVYADDPPRLATVLPFRLERPCLGAMRSLNAYNRDDDYVTLTCEDDGSLHTRLALPTSLTRFRLDL